MVDGPKKKRKAVNGNNSTSDHGGSSSTNLDKLVDILKYPRTFCGLIVMIYLGYRFSGLCESLHDAQLWFSNIKEVEREISFRTESGLFYSYYKQLVHSTNFFEGLVALTKDNITEHGVTMNVLARMNIYQEVILAFFYRFIITFNILPVYFYIRTIWLLHAGLLCGIFGMTWLMAKSWVAGMLAVALYIFNLADSSRVANTIPLRESFSLPFLWAQMFFITLYFGKECNTSNTRQVLAKVGIAASTFFFALFWQFNQFLLLMQSMALFGVQVLQLVPHDKVCYVYSCQTVALLLVAILQFGNTMIVGGTTISFTIAAILVMALQGDKPTTGGYIKRCFRVVAYIIAVFVFAACINKLIKSIIHVDSDEHIYKFVLHKFGISHSRDFDVKLYVCNGSFQFLTGDVYERLLQGFVLLTYIVFHGIALIVLLLGLLQKWKVESQMKKTDDPQESLSYWFQDRPDLAYHLIQGVFFGCLAITTLRMKFAWTPYMCIFTSLLLCDLHIYKYTAKLILKRDDSITHLLIDVTRWLVALSYLYVAYTQCWPNIQSQLDHLREFYDPDTVDLMEWAKNSTTPDASFTGSMQLLAGVKLCTGRPITNHPHYEDKDLRKRTKELYQMYARKTPEEVHKIMLKYQANYMILEDSICLAPSRDNCRLPDLLDIDNGEIPDIGKPKDGLRPSNVPRFCNEVRHMKPPYNKYFKLVFQNKTFRVYEVLKE